MDKPLTKLYNLFRFSSINFQTQTKFSFDQFYQQKASTLSLIEGKAEKIPMQKLNTFLIDQIKHDQILLKKQKEIIFLGRANVGKSSLINAIFNKDINRTSKTQGCTKKLFFHESNYGTLIDPPGYGFNQTSVRVRHYYYKFLYDYLQTSTRLCKIFLLVNLEHGLKSTDVQMISFLQKQNVKISLVFTKSDKVRENLEARMLAIAKQIQQYDKKNLIECIGFGVSSHEKSGIQELRYGITRAFIENEPRDLKGQEELVLAVKLGHNLKQFEQIQAQAQHMKRLLRQENYKLQTQYKLDSHK